MYRFEVSNADLLAVIATPNTVHRVVYLMKLMKIYTKILKQEWSESHPLVNLV